jgi:hypothetical protein
VLLLGEQRELAWPFYLGVAVIFAAVFAHPWLARRAAPSPQPQLLGISEAHNSAD